MTKQSGRQQIAEQAAEWCVSLRDSGGSSNKQCQEFIAWLLESPVHVHEYLEIAKLWGDAAGVYPDTETDVIAQTDGAGNVTDNIIKIDRTVAEQLAPTVKKRRRTSYAVAAGLLLALVGGLLWFNQQPATTLYATERGEQRSVALKDGSIVELNTGTQIAVTFASDQRTVELLRGEALFDVRKDAKRPFVVDAGGARISVLGTQFNIYRQRKGTAVTVLQGKVVVARSAQDELKTNPFGNEAVELVKGQQAYVGAGLSTIDKKTIENVQAIVAWTNRQLIFDARPLSEIVEEFNRYNNRRVTIQNPTLETLKLSGVFNSHDPDSLIEFVGRIRKIEVSHTEDGGWILR